MRTAYQRDRDRIVHANAFRRLRGKTQVFLAPAGDHYATRLSHALEVAQVARDLARALALNEDLAEAIALATISVTPRSATRVRRRSTSCLAVGISMTGRACASSASSRRVAAG